MRQKRYTVDQIIPKLRAADIELGKCEMNHAIELSISTLFVPEMLIASDSNEMLFVIEVASPSALKQVSEMREVICTCAT